MTVDLVAWLNGALDEDEAAAHAEEKWRAAHPPVPGVSYELPPLMAHSWDDPARVLAEVAAKRAILEQYRVALQQKDWPACTALEAVLPVLALPFAGRAGFDPSWLD